MKFQHIKLDRPGIDLRELARDAERVNRQNETRLAAIEGDRGATPAGDPWVPISRTEQTASVATEFAINGVFDGNNDGEYRFDIDLILVTGTSKTLDLGLRGPSSSDMDCVYNQGTSNVAVNTVWRLASFTTQTRMWGRILIEAPSRNQGRSYRWDGGICQAGTASSCIPIRGFGHLDDNTTNITGFTITSSVNDKIAAGSVVRAYRRQVRR